MNNIPVECFACEKSIPESEYPEHMQTVHGGMTQQDALAQKALIEQNLPKGMPPELAASLPSEEFEATIKEIEKAEAEAKKPKKPQEQSSSSIPKTPVEQKPLELKYKYEGTCENGHEVKTLEVDVAEKHFAIAFCSNCNEQVESREVEDLYVLSPIAKKRLEKLVEEDARLKGDVKELRKKK